MNWGPMPTSEERAQYQCGTTNPEQPDVTCQLMAGHPGDLCNDMRGHWWPTPPQEQQP